MKHLLLLSAIIPLFTALAMPLKWTCNFPEASAVTFSIYQGETVTFEPTFRVNGVETPLQIANIYYQTNGMADAWWKLDGSTFAPTNDVGAKTYRFFIQADGANGKNYRANGTLRMLPSPGFVPNSLAAADRIIDSENFAEAVKAVELPVDESLVAELAEYSGINLPTAGITSIGFLLVVLISTIAAIKNKKADMTALDNYKRTQTKKNSPSASGYGDSFIDTITQDAQGVITATKKSIRHSNIGQRGLVALYGNRVRDFESGMGYYDPDAKLFGEIESSGGDFGAASNHALAYTTLGHVRFFTLDPYQDMDCFCYVYPRPFCHDICWTPYGIPSYGRVKIFFDTEQGYPWQVLSTRSGDSEEWSGSKKAIVEIDAFDLRNDVAVDFVGYVDGGSLGVTGLAYGNCGKDEWNTITAGMVNRFYLEMNYDRLTVIKYAFPQYLFDGGSSYWSSYYSSYWSSYYSSYWSSYYSY